MDVRELIRRRLIRYLSMDKTGIRRAVLKLILKFKQVTVDLVYAVLKSKFAISLSKVKAMLGSMVVKLGILRTIKPSYKHQRIYVLKSEYEDLVRACLALY